MSRTLSCMMLPWAIFNGLLPRDRPFSREEQLHILGACIRPSARMSAYPFLDSVSAWFERGQKPKALPRLETDYLDLFVSGGNQYNFWMWCLLLIPICWNICSKKSLGHFDHAVFVALTTSLSCLSVLSLLLISLLVRVLMQTFDLELSTS